MRIALAVLLAFCVSCAKKPANSLTPFVDEYWTESFKSSPSSATAAGIHDYDNQIEDLSERAVMARKAKVEELAGKLKAIRETGPLNDEDSIDAELLQSLIDAELLEINVVKSYRINPMGYVGTPGNAIDVLMKRNFAPAHDRLKSVVARLRGIPPMLEAMRANVVNPPKEFTDLAMRMAGGSVGFFKNSVATWAKDAAGDDKALMAEFNDANGKAAAAMEAAAKWLKDDLLPRSKGSYAIGADTFAKKLAYEEMVDIPLDKLLAIGEANLEKDYQAFVATAKQIDAKKTPAQVMASLSNDHPTADDLIPATRRTLASVQKFVIDHKIIPLPTERMPLVEETPPYARSGSFASMDTPGAFETKATEAFYYVTPPEKNWDKKHVEEHLREYNKWVLDNITVHEVFPGHYTQFIYASQFPTKTRKLYQCGTNAEGWAHYSEQMMIEEGFASGEPKAHLAQLSDALLRDARYVVGIKLHTKGMTVEEGAKLFVEKAFQEPANGFEESRRGAYNPTYLYYTLGKLQIYKLRDDYSKAKGADYSLAKFHSEFIKQGSVPLKVMRKVLLGAESPTL